MIVRIDIRLSANVRSSSEVEVYFRTTSSAETRDIRTLAFTPFNTDGKEDVAVALLKEIINLKSISIQ